MSRGPPPLRTRPEVRRHSTEGDGHQSRDRDRRRQGLLTTDEALVERARLLPLAMASDITQGRLEWAGNYLVNPWDEDRLVERGEYPRLKSYL